MNGAHENMQAKDAAAVRAAAEAVGVTGSRLVAACEHLIAEEKAAANQVALNQMRAAVQAEANRSDNAYQRVLDGNLGN